MYKFCCGTPKEYCTGDLTVVNNSIKTLRTHGTSEQAFKCYRNYLLKTGYKQIGSRDFSPPDGGPVLLLNKKSKFGGKLRVGKGGEKGIKGNRFMPRGNKCNECKGGMIF